MIVGYFDTVAGIAGDMTLAAFLSAGLPFEELRADLSLLELGGYDMAVRHVQRNGIDAVHLSVDVTSPAHIHRTLDGILSLVGRSALPAGVKDRTERMFRILADGEARVHGTTPEKVHFHEVGAVDSIVDIVGAAICLERFAIDQVYSSPVRLGRSGTVRTEHGILPVPAPAVLEILKNYPVTLTSIPDELTTPTGAVIIKAFSAGLLDDEQLLIDRLGYGAGSRHIDEIPNVLRLVVGTIVAPSDGDRVAIIETTIDDMNPQVYPALIDQLLVSGALDAYLTPVIMKKGRPGILLTVLADRSALEAVTGVLYRETTTIGLRIRDIGRRKLPRRHLEARTRFGVVRVKAVVRDGQEVFAAEFEECRRIAAERGIPLLDVLRLVNQDLNAPDTQANP